MTANETPTPAAQNKSTPNVRKILQSQKTFANHLDDFQAMIAHAENNPTPSSGGNGGGPSSKAAGGPPPPPHPAPGIKRGAAQKATASSKAGRRTSTPAKAPTPAKASSAAAAAAADQSSQDVEMADAADADTEPPPQQQQQQLAPPADSYPADGTVLPAYGRAPPRAHAGDTDPLLASRVPPFPADDELRALLSAAPLSYLEARAGAGGEVREAGGYPVRRFCEVCGYWGRVRCAGCGARVCALDCLDVHREDCVTRYGA